MRLRPCTGSIVLLPIGSRPLVFRTRGNASGRIVRRRDLRLFAEDSTAPLRADMAQSLKLSLGILEGPGGSNGVTVATMCKGEHWICSNPECRCEVFVVHPAVTTEGENPQCTCGFPMRKPYIAPIFRAIRDFDELKHLQEMFSPKAQ